MLPGNKETDQKFVDVTRCFGMRINFEGTHGASCCVWSALDGINMEYVSRALLLFE